MNKPQPDASAGAPAPSEAGDLDRIVADLAKAGLADYLSDADIAKQVVDWLHEETGIHRAFLKLAIKAVAALVEQAAKESGSWLGRIATDRLKQILRAIPGYEKLVNALENLLGRFDRKIKAKRELKEVIDRRRLASDAAFASDLSLDFQTHLLQLRNDQDLAAQMGEGFLATAARLAEIEARFNKQPPLQLRLLEQTRAARFTYRAQVASSVGRERKLASLRSFLDADGPIRRNRRSAKRKA